MGNAIFAGVITMVTVFIVVDGVVSIIDRCFYPVCEVVLSGIVGIVTGLIVFFVALDNNKEYEKSWEQGETVTVLVKRVDFRQGKVYILTEDSEVFTRYATEYKLLIPGDTLVYLQSTQGKTRILSVRYSGEEYLSQNVEEEVKKNQSDVVYMPNPSYYIYGEGAPVICY